MAEIGIELELVGADELAEIVAEIEKKTAELNMLADKFKTAASNITVRSVEHSES